MTYELATISMHDLNSVTGAHGPFDSLVQQMQRQRLQQRQHPGKQPSASPPKGPSELGNACRDAYSAVGGWAGALASPEFGGLGAIPGTILGGILGRAVCPP